MRCRGDRADGAGGGAVAAVGSRRSRLHQGRRAGRRDHQRPRRRRHRRAGARGADGRHSRRQHRNARRCRGRCASRCHDHRRHRQDDPARPGDAARASLLSNRPANLRAARAELHAALPRRRRDDDAHRRQRERRDGHHAQAVDRSRPAAGTVDRRDRPLLERRQHVPPDARPRGRRRRTAAGRVLGGHGGDVVQGLHANQPVAAEGRDR